MTTSNSTPPASGQDPGQPSPARAITCDQAQDQYRSTTGARERFVELANRDLMARAHATLAARGTFDPARHADPATYPPLTVTEHLKVLAAGEMLARHYRHPAHVHHAVLAGATWEQVAEATGTGEAAARQAYRQWADGQHSLYAGYDGQFGMSHAEHAAALARAAGPPAKAGIEREAEP